jgi:HEAT repeat protein
VTDAKAADFYARNLADLGSWNKARQVEAAKRLAGAPPIELRAEIAAALEKWSDHPDRELQRAAREALGRWDGEGAIAALVDLLGESDASRRAAAIRSLASTGEIAAAEAIAGVMDQEPDEAAAALRTMGPVAEGPALAVLRRAPEVASRAEAAKVLGTVGTAKSVAALEEAAASNDAALARAAKDAVRAIKGRGN